MKNSTNKSKMFTIVLILTLSISGIIIILPTVAAQKARTTIELYFAYNPIGVGQPLRVGTVWSARDLLIPDQILQGSHAILEKPDGTTETLGPFTPLEVNMRYVIFQFVPDQVGTWYVQFTWDGNENYEAAASPKLPVTVQQAPVDIVRQNTIAYLYFRPNPIGIDQSLLVNAWVSPRPIIRGDLYDDYYFTFTKPDGTTNTIGPITSYADGSTWFETVVDQVGTWYIEFSWDGNEYNKACTSGKLPLVVQEDPIPSWPPAPLPSEPWDFPVNPNNREWYSIIGPYLQPTGGSGLGYDSTGQRFNPYSQAPNTAHILWKLPPVNGVAGLVGGQFGQLITYGSTRPMINVVMAGRGYYTTGGNIYCVDIKTGELLWTTPGSYSFGAIEGSSTSMQPYLVSIGSNLIKYNALTGEQVLNIKVFSGSISYLANDYQYAYVAERDPAVDTVTGQYYLVKLDFTGTSNNLEDRVVYNVTYPLNTIDCGICLYGDILSLIHFPIFLDSGAVNTTTGEMLWQRRIGPSEGYIEQKPEGVTSLNGVIFFAKENRFFEAVDMKTGNVVWDSEQTDYPWGNFWAYGQSAAYGNIYALSYAGVYAFDATTGKINWHYSAGDSGYETPYGTWAFGSADPIVADGKVYAPATEHSPTFYYRGEKLHCIDAYTGDGIWSILGNYRVEAVAEGCLFASNAYDGNAYTFSKGPTTTTVSVTPNVIGTGVLIHGTVTDQSPAQIGTPAIADEDMSAWMEYLHMQQPCPAEINGVPVTLDTIDPNGNFIHIATVTSNSYGSFAHSWTPEIEGEYIIIATFEGSDSYYASYAETVMGVGPGVSTAQPIEPEEPRTEIPLNTTELAIILAVVLVAIGLIAFWVLRKRK